MSDLIVTDAAANKILKLINLENDKELALRLAVVGGGCSGMQYSFAFTKDIDDWCSMR